MKNFSIENVIIKCSLNVGMSKKTLKCECVYGKIFNLYSEVRDALIFHCNL